MSDSPNPQPDPLDADLRAALDPPGRSGAQPQRWALAGALALLAAGAALLIWRSVAAMPAPASVEAPPALPPMIASAPKIFAPQAERTIAHRQALLTALAQAGNIFAPDRAPWPAPPDVAQEQSSDEHAVTLGASTDVAPPAVREPDGGLNLADIPLTPVSNQLPPALFREASAMKLEVLFGVVAPSAAQPDLGAAIRRGDVRGVYREGDAVPGEGGPWRLLAIDLDTERVILAKQGHNIQLRLRNQPAAPALVAATPQATPARRPSGLSDPADSPRVARASLESVRAQLRDAGLAAWEIDAILRLAQRPEPETTTTTGDTAQTSSAAAGESGPPPANRPNVKPPVVPAEIAALLRMMTSGRAPTTPPTQPPDEEDQKQSEGDQDPDGGS